ncbi:protein nanos-like [Chironomus tepperi]|uniref:protein nanos-like n=1 Tax=Chironomus tepperi TaxID=113505 RepID=UPI00391F0107
MFYENNYVNSSYQNFNNYYEYQYGTQYKANYPVVESNTYQEDINKCLSSVNSDYNSHRSVTNDSFLSSSQECSVRDSGIESDLDSTNTSNKKIHLHQNKLDEDDCQLCRDTTAYLLSTPFINYLDHNFSASDSNKVSLSSDETNYVEYKLLKSFNFAASKKLMQKDSFKSNLIQPCMFAENMHSVRTEFEYNGKTVDDSDRKVLRENEMQRPYPMTQYYDYKNELYSFQPNSNSTPDKYIFNQQQQYCNVNNSNQYLNSNDLPWKKPVILDPRLSARYDAVFPSLDISSNHVNYDNQSTSINDALENNILYCAFCKNTDRYRHLFDTHNLRDSTGRVSCPILRNFICKICGESGDNAHTVKYCPLKYILMLKSQTTLH